MEHNGNKGTLCESLSYVPMTKPVSLPRPEAPPLSCLSGADIAALSKQREARWRPGLADQPLHSEIFASALDGSGAGLALALARDALSVAAEAIQDAPLAEAEDRRQLLWVQDKRAVQMNGRPYLHGLPEEWRERVICVEAGKAEDALFALEEGLKCRELACVIGEVAGNPRALDFTASRRLSLTAEKHGVALWLVRLEAEADLSSARMRWRARPSVSSQPRWNAQSPGEPQWQTELFRARSHAPGEWKLSQKGGFQKSGRLCVETPPQTPIKTPKHPLEHMPNVLLSKRTPYRSTYSGNLVRATVGRSMAAVARG
jgi:protein ImuA